MTPPAPDRVELQSWRRRDARLAWVLVVPALAVLGVVSIAPIGWTFWESLHLHDLRMPWLGRPFIGLSNYVEAARDARFLGAAAHTAAFAVVAVSIEMMAGLALALALDRLTGTARLVRTAILLPWAVPTVVAALMWRFIFESPGGLATQLAGRVGIVAPTWLADPVAAWLPIILADTWKTTPFVALLLVAGLQNIDRSLYEAAATDGASAWRQFREITLPLLRPALFVAFLFRALDAFRVFDIVYVLTAGGPGTSTEPVALYTFTTLLNNLRFGYGSALSMLVFVVSFLLAVAAVRLMSEPPAPARNT